jgi:hypothetical protein
MSRLFDMSISVTPDFSPVNVYGVAEEPFQRLSHAPKQPVETGFDIPLFGFTRLKPGVNGRSKLGPAGSNN